MKKTYPAFLVLALGLFTAVILIGGAGIGVSLDLPSAGMIAGLAIVLSLAGNSLKEIAGYYREVFKPAVEAEVVILRKGERYFRMLRLYLILSGFCGTLSGLIVMLSVLDDPHAVGRGMAMSLLTLFYALILVLVVALPFEQASKKLLIERGE